MSISKSILLTAVLYTLASLLDLLILSFDGNFSLYPHIVGLSEILPYLITYSLFIVYFRFSRLDVSLKERSAPLNYVALLPILILLAIGDHLIDLPFFEWRGLSNSYLGTSWQVPDYSNYRFSNLRLYSGFSALIVAPIFEEIFFRYYIFGGLLRRYNFRIAIFTSSLLFSVIHIGSLENLRNVIPAFAFGIVSCLVYFRTKKILVPIILHFLTNAIWYATVIFAKRYNDLLKNIGFGISFWILVLIGIMVLVVGIKKITTANRRLAASLHTIGLADK
jgi:uncharacterized protein